MEPQTPIGDEKQTNMGPTGIQKGVRKGSKSETLEKLKIELPLQRELRSDHERAPQWSLKTGSLTGSIETKPEERSEAPYERQMVSRGAKMETTPAWGSLRHEPSGG